MWLLILLRSRRLLPPSSALRPQVRPTQPPPAVSFVPITESRKAVLCSQRAPQSSVGPAALSAAPETGLPSNCAVFALI